MNKRIALTIFVVTLMLASIHGVFAGGKVDKLTSDKSANFMVVASKGYNFTPLKGDKFMLELNGVYNVSYGLADHHNGQGILMPENMVLKWKELFPDYKPTAMMAIDEGRALVNVVFKVEKAIFKEKEAKMTLMGTYSPSTKKLPIAKVSKKVVSKAPLSVFVDSSLSCKFFGSGC